MDWMDVPNKVDVTPPVVETKDDTRTIGRKGCMSRIQSKTTKIPVLEMRKRTPSLLCSSKQNHPLMSDEDGAVHTRRMTHLNSNNDTTGLWFMKTFDNHYDDDDDMTNTPPTTYFPPSPLDIPSFHHSNNGLRKDTTMESSGYESLPMKSSRKPFEDGSTLDNHPNPNGIHHEALHHLRDNTFPTVTSAILGNVFAEEIAADTAADAATTATTTSTTKPVVAAVSRTANSSVRSRPSSKLIFPPSSSRTVTSTSTVPTLDGSSNCSMPSHEGATSAYASSRTTNIPPPQSSRISATIAQLCQTNKNAKFQKKSLIQTRKDQLAKNLDRNRSTTRNRISKGSWQKDSNGNFKRHFVLVDDHRRPTP
jgi:hypothetical protein